MPLVRTGEVIVDKTRFDDEAGITLVEVLVSIVILGIVLTAFFQVMAGNLQSLSDSRARQEASQLTTEVIELLRSFQPPEIAMFDDPLMTDPDEFVMTFSTVGCVAGQVDPDGDGPIGCEALRGTDGGAITSVLPWQGSRPGSPITISTWATDATGTDVPPDSIRVTVTATYELTDGPQVVRRQALFSRVGRGG